MRYLRNPSLESLESRRLLAQLPQPLGQLGMCGSPLISEEANIACFAGHNGVGWFGCGSSNWLQDLWRTDGTPSGTYALGEDLGDGIVTDRLVELEGDVYFKALANSGDKLIQSDGTPNSWIAISYWGGAAAPIGLNGDVLFNYVDHTTQTQEIRKVLDSGFETVKALPGADESWFVYSQQRIGEHVVFFLEGDLWSTDGTSEGTVRLQELKPIRGTVGNVLGVTSDERLLFLAADETNSISLWSTDGTSRGTFKLRQVSPTVDASVLILGEGHPERWVFSVTAQEGPTTLWASDGSANGTAELGKIDRHSSTYAEQLGNHYFFPPDARLGPRVIRATDGVSLVDLVEITEPTTFAFPCCPTRPMMPTFSIGDEIYFDADGQLWKTDGTHGGTLSLTDLGTGVIFEERFGHDQFHGFQLHATEKYLYFEQESPKGLFQVDRSTGDTRTVAKEAVALQAGADTFLIYEADSDETKWMVTDDEPHHPVKVSDELGVNFESFSLLLDEGDSMFFRGSSPTAGEGYWLTDGTAAGTIQQSELPEPILVDKLNENEIVETETNNVFQFKDTVILEVTYFGRFRGVLSTQLFSIDLVRPGDIQGDVDQDGVVGFLDFLILAHNFGRTAAASTDGDIDGDGVVSWEDFTLLHANFDA